MSDTYTVRRATMDDVKDIHALLMENARKGLLLPRALIFLYGHVHEVDKGVLPQKIWADCVHCAKYPDCDETAMFLELD